MLCLRKSKVTSRITLMILVSILLLGIFSGCAKEESDITICQWGQSLIYLPFYIAMEKGYFTEQGLSVKVVNGGSDDLTWTAVTSGNAQFGIADPTMVAIQSEQGGVPGKVVGTVVNGVAFWAVTLDQNMIPIEKPEDFKGHTVACFRFPNTAHAMLLKTLQKGNLKKGVDTKIVEVNYGAVLAQLRRGEADMAMVLEPQASFAVHEGARVVYSYPKDWGPFSFTGLTTTQKYIDKHPDIVQKVVDAIEKACRFAHTDFEGVVDVGTKAFPDLPEDVIRMAIRRMLDEKTLPEHVVTSDEAWQKAIQVCVDVGKLKKIYPTEKFVNNSFAEKAIAQYDK